jgi:glycosyltransferase involved in cell wall biosynthesis
MASGPESRFAFARFAYRQLRQERPDFVLAQGYGPAALAVRATGIPSASLICSPVEKYYQCRRGAADPSKPFRTFELLALKTLARINAFLQPWYFVLSRHLEDVVRSHGARRVRRIPVYGVDFRVFHPGQDRATLRKKLTLPEGPLLFFSSRIAPEKDAGTLLAAVRLLRDRGRQIHILHRSGGFREFRSLAEQFAVGDLVVATDAHPPFEKLADDYRACDLTVQASREEGLGFSVLESMACGTPVIAAAVGGLLETVIDGKTGWSYPVGDAAALAATIEEVLQNPEEAARRTAAGGEMVKEEYERSLVFDQLDDAIHSILRKGRR